jgi:hypothetical protein
MCEVPVKVEEESPVYRRLDKSKRRNKHRPGRFSERPARVNLDSNYNYSLWSITENAAYMYFLEAHNWLFERSNSDRRLLKINVLMSLWVKTRSPDQCRSHHQKMMKYHSDIPTIITHIRKCMEDSKMGVAVKMEHEEVKMEEAAVEGGVVVKVEEEKEGVSSNDF